MRKEDRDIQLLIDLLSQGWDEKLTDEDNAKLNAVLQEGGPRLAKAVLNASSLHLEMSQHVISAELFDRAMSAIHQAETPVELSRSESPPATPAWTLQRARPRAWSIAAIAALLLAALSLSVSLDHVPKPDAPPRDRIARLLRPSKPVGNVVTVTQAVWGEGSQVEVGNAVLENQHLELVSGTAQLSMSRGADLVLQGPCSVTLVSDDYAKLESGKLTVQAAEWATGFAVAANDLKVTDLGTRFALSADSEGVVEAHVLEGSVLAEPLGEKQPKQQSVHLQSGQGIRIDGGAHSKVSLIEARRDDFVDELTQFRPLRQIPIWNTGGGAQVGAEDPYWRVLSGSEENGPFPRQAVITEGDTRSYQDNKPDVSQWISIVAEGYPGVPPESVHRFETRFDLTGFDPSTVRLVGYFLVDDAINELRINGHPIDYKRWVATWDVFDFKSFHPIEIDDHFVAGENVITIDVYNSPSRPENPASPNPTALRVEWQAFGEAVAP